MLYLKPSFLSSVCQICNLRDIIAPPTCCSNLVFVWDSQLEEAGFKGEALVSNRGPIFNVMDLSCLCAFRCFDVAVLSSCLSL